MCPTAQSGTLGRSVPPGVGSRMIPKPDVPNADEERLMGAIGHCAIAGVKLRKGASTQDTATWVKKPLVSAGAANLAIAAR